MKYLKDIPENLRLDLADQLNPNPNRLGDGIAARQVRPISSSALYGFVQFDKIKHDPVALKAWPWPLTGVVADLGQKSQDASTRSNSGATTNLGSNA